MTIIAPGPPRGVGTSDAPDSPRNVFPGTFGAKRVDPRTLTWRQRIAAFNGARFDAAVLRWCYRYVIGAVAVVTRRVQPPDQDRSRTSTWDVPR